MCWPGNWPTQQRWAPTITSAVSTLDLFIFPLQLMLGKGQVRMYNDTAIFYK